MSVTVIGSHVNTRSTCHIKNNKYRIKTASSISFLNQRHIATPSRLESLWDETEAAFSYRFLNIPEQTSRLVFVMKLVGLQGLNRGLSRLADPSSSSPTPR
ncbi:hypothetical protein E4U27_002864 [Claviceps purpurea]|nr:hypothetical protein E4U27_002864 [Claviceps purpurea]